MKLPARGRAGGKVILLGEHAVVYGRPALAAGLTLGIEVELAPATGPVKLESDPPVPAADTRPLALVHEAFALFDLPAQDLVVRVRSTLPTAVGLGSSAAFAVALLRALAAATGRTIALTEELMLARRLEAIFHGHPSGVDPAAAALPPGTCVRFVRGEPPQVTPLRPGVATPLVVAVAGGPRATGAAVTGLRARWEAERARYERLFDAIGDVVDDGTRALVAGDLPALGSAFDRNQALLGELGVSSAALDGLVATARAAGALGAKLTGGGGGGAIIALAPDAAPVTRALGQHGAETLLVHVGA